MSDVGERFLIDFLLILVHEIDEKAVKILMAKRTTFACDFRAQFDLPLATNLRSAEKALYIFRSELFDQLLDSFAT